MKLAVIAAARQETPAGKRIEDFTPLMISLKYITSLALAFVNKILIIELYDKISMAYIVRFKENLSC